ncbi:MAG: hypothetical protein PHS48_06595 [Bacteroidales bacterium]|nr:hypothetical protein [Bacteroidales bacterium]
MKKIIFILLLVNFLPIFASAEEYYYAFMTTCGHTAWLTTHHDLSNAEILEYGDHYEALYCSTTLQEPIP